MAKPAEKNNTMSIRERIARVLCRQQHISLYGSEVWRPGELDAKVDSYWSKHISTVDAVLIELEVPTEGMIAVGFELAGDPCWPEDVAKIWQAMLTEARKP